MLIQKVINYSFLQPNNFYFQNSWWSKGSNASCGWSLFLHSASLKMCEEISDCRNPIYSRFYSWGINSVLNWLFKASSSCSMVLVFWVFFSPLYRRHWIWAGCYFRVYNGLLWDCQTIILSYISYVKDWVDISRWEVRTQFWENGTRTLKCIRAFHLSYANSGQQNPLDVSRSCAENSFFLTALTFWMLIASCNIALCVEEVQISNP